MIIAKTINELLAVQGKSLDDLLEYLRIGKQHYQSLAGNNFTQMRANQFCKLAGYLGVTSAFLERMGKYESFGRIKK